MWALTVALTLQTHPADPAAAWPDDRPFTRILQNLVHDLRSLPSVTTGLVLGAGGAAAAATHAADDDLVGWATRSGDASYTSFGRVVGEGWVQGAAAVATYVAGRLADQPRVTHIGSDLIRTQVLNGVLTQGLKLAVNRERPTGSEHAFPSGHTSATVASATVLHAHFGWKVGAPAYALAGFVGWSRIRDGQHWASDVVFGAALGLASGLTVTRGHRTGSWSVVPVRTKGGFAILVHRRSANGNRRAGSTNR
jgi:membrane-associated phospholipid phosphatase